MPGTPAAARELRAQGRKTMRKLLDAGMRVFAERGFHAARVDDIVRTARTSHGTFYLYFANKEELLRALAIQCAQEMGALAGGLGEVRGDEAGAIELRRFLETFFSTYARFGPVLRGLDGRQCRRPRDQPSRRGRVHRHRGRTRGADGGSGRPSRCRRRFRRSWRCSNASRTSSCRGELEFDSDALFDTVTLVVHRGFFGAPLAA